MVSRIHARSLPIRALVCASIIVICRSAASTLSFAAEAASLAALAALAAAEVWTITTISVRKANPASHQSGNTYQCDVPKKIKFRELSITDTLAPK